MIDSGSGDPFTTKTIDLKVRLERAKAQHENRIHQIETDAFTSYETDLKSLLTDARNTLASDFETLEKIFSSHRECLAIEINKNNRRMLWLIRVPVLLTFMACTVTMGLEVLWFRIENQNRVHLAPWSRGAQKYLILDEPDWSLCTTETTELPDMKKDGTTRKVIAIMQEPCKPVE